MNSSKLDFLLIVAPSARALAQAARASGYLPLAADFFDDLDTRDAAEANCLIEGNLDRGFEAGPLMAALNSLADGKQISGLIYGAGFEDRVELLQLLAERWPLLGNPPSVVGRVKDPAALAALCKDLGIPHPEIRFEPLAFADHADEWLVKQAGGSGGIHVGAAGTSLSAGGYYQRRVAGIPISSLILADGTQALTLGLSEQWACPAPDQPWRFGGSVRPATLDVKLAENIERASKTIAQAAHLVGLNSVDFLVDGDDFHLIEINPRPGATLDIFHDSENRLLRAHIAACLGHLPEQPLRFNAAEAAAFVYAPFAIPCMPAIDWPAWAADRQKPSSVVAENDPLCSVTANGPDLISARHHLDERGAHILTLVSKTDSGREAAA